VPQEPGTAALPGMTSPAGTADLAGATGLAGAASPGRCGRPCQVQPTLHRATSLVPIESFPACTTWMNEIDQGNVGLIEWMKL
jgi:hypothetical protein